jgi:hypothetical protein
MIPIYIDTRALFEGLSITDEQCNAFVDNVVKDITYGYFVQLNKEAESALDSTRSRYIRNIRLVDSGKMSGTVILDYSKDKLVRMVEEGASAFDMKPDFLNSSKVKTGKNGNRYLTIPFRLSNPNAVADSSMFAGKLPKAVYVEVKNKPSTIYVSGGGTRSAGLKPSEIPEPYDERLTRPTILDDSGNVLFDEYVHKSSIYAGVFKQTDNVTGQNTYNSFRRVSENSDKLAWIHKGITAKGLMEVAFANFNIESEIGASIDKRFNSLF